MAEINFGDVIYVKRDFGYKHFGIYSGDKKVIHYVKDGGDLLDGVICETSLKKFLDGERICYIVDFDNFGRRIHNRQIQPYAGGAITASRINIFDVILIGKSLYDLFFGEERKLYSPEETVQRAREHTEPGKNRGYDLFFHNCEHFAIWCKTGVAESEQIDEFLKFLGNISRRVTV